MRSAETSLRERTAEAAAVDYLGKLRKLRQAVGEALRVLEKGLDPEGVEYQPHERGAIHVLKETMEETWFPGVDNDLEEALSGRCERLEGSPCDAGAEKG